MCGSGRFRIDPLVSLSTDIERVLDTAENIETVTMEFYKIYTYSKMHYYILTQILTYLITVINY